MARVPPSAGSLSPATRRVELAADVPPALHPIQADIWRSDTVSPLARAVPLVNTQHNATVTQLEASAKWQALLELLGPRAMVDLLSSPNLALFGVLPRACYRQISGTVVYDLKPLSLLEKQLTPLDIQPSATLAGAESVSTIDCDRARPRCAGSPLKRRATTPAFLGLPTLPESPAAQPYLPSKRSLDSTEMARDDVYSIKRRRVLVPSASVPALAPPPATALPTPGRLPPRTFAKTRSETSLLGTGVGPFITVGPSAAQPSKRARQEVLLKPSQVELVRHRMHHAKPSRNGAGHIVYGLSKKSEFNQSAPGACD